MSTPKLKASACEACGKELLISGNYRFRITPAKKMPKKAIKLYHNPLLQNENPWEESKFRKHLRERSQPKNSIEITCGYCKSNTKLRMSKPKFVPTRNTPGPYSSLSLPAGDTGPNSSKKRNKRPKPPKDLNAGLIIPASMLATSSASNYSTPLTPLTSSLHTSASEPQKTSVGKSPKLNPEMKKKLAQAEKQSKLKAMDNLKKVLYKSKQIGSSSSNLQNFFGDS